MRWSGSSLIAQQLVYAHAGRTCAALHSRRVLDCPLLDLGLRKKMRQAQAGALTGSREWCVWLRKEGTDRWVTSAAR